MKRSTLLLPFLLFATLARGGEAENRLAFGVNKARAVDAVIASLYPGATVRWQGQLSAVMADGTVRPMRVADVLERQETDGFTFVMPIEFLDNESRITAALDEFTPGAEKSLTEMVAVKVNGGFAITAIRRGTLPDEAHITRAESLDEAPGATAVWPGVILVYNGYYGTSDWVGQVQWESKVVFEPQVAVTHRLPHLVARASKDGTTVADANALIIVTATDRIDVYSPSQKRHVVSCTAPCVLEGKTLLGLWAPSSSVVAIKP